MTTPPPADAQVLLDRPWQHRDGTASRWSLREGVLEIVPGTGDVLGGEALSEFQLHLEFWLPLMEQAHGQDRANSGVYVLGRYEIQVLDSWAQPLRDDSCGAIYKRAAPLQSACLPPEQWQSYDIAFSRGDGLRMTVLHNGLLIHHGHRLEETPGGIGADHPAQPLVLLQDHGAPVRFRNIWAVGAR